MADTKTSDLTFAEAALADLLYLAEAQGTSPETYVRRHTTPASLLKLVAYDIPVGVGDTPSAGEILARFTMVRDLELPANFTGSQGTEPDTLPDASFAITIQEVDKTTSPTTTMTLGTVTISTAGAYTFATESGTAKTVDAGNEIQAVAPSSSPAEASIAGFSFTLKATVSS